VKRYLWESCLFGLGLVSAALAGYFHARYSQLAPYYPSSNQRFSWIATSPAGNLHLYFMEFLTLAVISMGTTLIMLYNRRHPK
jgi:hypothetical protein